MKPSFSRTILSFSRRLDGIFITKCIVVMCAFIILEGVFVANRWISSSIVTTEKLDSLIPLQDGEYKVSESGSNYSVNFIIGKIELDGNISL